MESRHSVQDYSGLLVGQKPRTHAFIHDLCVVGGLQRLTYSKESGYKRQDMQCPEMAREYNQEGMGGGDSNDRMKLARRTSCEMNLVSKRWDWRLFWGLMDIAITNAFVLYTFFHKTTTHSQFFFELAFAWFKDTRKAFVCLGGAVGFGDPSISASTTPQILQI